jgi:hypothetical protein
MVAGRDEGGTREGGKDHGKVNRETLSQFMTTGKRREEN